MADNNFGSVLKRLLSGQPAFVPENSRSPKDSVHQEGMGGHVSGESQTQYRQANGRKVYPDVRIIKCEFHRSGDHAEVWVDIENLSHFDIELDKIRAYGLTTELDTPLKSHTGRQFRVYSGHAMKTKPSDKAELIYKIKGNGDYFMHPHYVIARPESDGVYVVSEFRPQANLISDI